MLSCCCGELDFCDVRSVEQCSKIAPHACVLEELCVIVCGIDSCVCVCRIILAVARTWAARTRMLLFRFRFSSKLSG